MPGDEEGRGVKGLPCKHREDAEEFIDQPETSVDDIRDTERDQAKVNRLLGGANATLLHAIPVLAACSSNPVRILDAACGGGDLSRRLVDKSRKLNKSVEVTALDINEKAIACALESSHAYPEITYIQGNLLHPPFDPGEFDIVILSTVLHHLARDKVVTALQVARSLCRGTVIAADLVRSTWAYFGIHIFAKLAFFNPISEHDGAISVCRAYTPIEFSEFAHLAGLEPSRIYRHRFFRMTLVYPADSPSRMVICRDG